MYFAAGLPNLTWQPTDVDPVALKSISAYRDLAALPNLQSSVKLDVQAAAWPITRADALVCINMLHIAPWSAAEGLIVGAGRVLPPGGVLYLMDLSSKAGSIRGRAMRLLMRASAPAIPNGECAPMWPNSREGKGLELAEHIAMLANNLRVVFRRAPK